MEMEHFWMTTNGITVFLPDNKYLKILPQISHIIMIAIVSFRIAEDDTPGGGGGYMGPGGGGGPPNIGGGGKLWGGVMGGRG